VDGSALFVGEDQVVVGPASTDDFTNGLEPKLRSPNPHSSVGCRLHLLTTSEAISDEELARYRALAERSLEDHRGVDLTQVRERLRLTPAERVAKLVGEVEMYRQIRESVHANSA